MITQSQLITDFYYAEDTGKLYRRKNGKLVETGTKRKDGYIIVGYNYKTYLAHRIIWLYVFGEMPLYIDHIDGDPSNNKITNLRNVTQKENRANRTKLNKNNSTGLSNIQFHGKRGYIVRIGGSYVGHTTNLQDAISLRDSTLSRSNYRGI